ncbi:DedA family protein [Bacillus sp. EB01]|uniref:DedA family protein n=1 Tax=Bacillus sp. EB01 TaxID=1347086 RepID=UPI0006942803|nr:DedA family protein [Bacillus sp. EB01]
MEMEFLVTMLKESGYTGLFLWILLGASTLPVPNELIMMTIGLAASQTPSHAGPIFLTTIAGVLSAVSGSYLLGRLIGHPLLQFLLRNERFAKKLSSSQRLMEKYHAYSLSFSYFLPGARSIIPFLYGFSKLSFRKFALYAYSGATLWVFIMFTAGYLFGDHIDVAAAYAGEIGLVILILAAIIIATVKRHRKRKPSGDDLDQPIVRVTVPALQKPE